MKCSLRKFLLIFLLIFLLGIVFIYFKTAPDRAEKKRQYKIARIESCERLGEEYDWDGRSTCIHVCPNGIKEFDKIEKQDNGWYIIYYSDKTIANTWTLPTRCMRSK